MGFDIRDKRNGPQIVFSCTGSTAAIGRHLIVSCKNQLCRFVLLFAFVQNGGSTNVHRLSRCIGNPTRFKFNSGYAGLATFATGRKYWRWSDRGRVWLNEQRLGNGSIGNDGYHLFGKGVSPIGQIDIGPDLVTNVTIVTCTQFGRRRRIMAERKGKGCRDFRSSWKDNLFLGSGKFLSCFYVSGFGIFWSIGLNVNIVASKHVGLAKTRSLMDM
mmetsp:Transcript_8535/g.20552  ORF Transcript_8535/g.20552 Transcript_8535/m.20552 type:complete len:215 (-) Transcript_8535:752-1396(-)